MNDTLSNAIFNEHVKHLANPRLVNLRFWAVNDLTYPYIDITFKQPNRIAFRIRLQCNSWNEMPPSIELLSEEGEYLKRLPQGSGVLNQGPHEATGRPFICSPGALEYHIHPSHITDLWQNYKGKSSYDLGGIITQIWNAWRNTND